MGAGEAGCCAHSALLPVPTMSAELQCQGTATHAAAKDMGRCDERGVHIRAAAHDHANLFGNPLIAFGQWSYQLMISLSQHSVGSTRLNPIYSLQEELHSPLLVVFVQIAREELGPIRNIRG